MFNKIQLDQSCKRKQMIYKDMFHKLQQKAFI